MSFPKAQIKRFNDIASCAPPPGKYDPKLPSVSQGSGISFPKGDRFRTDIGGSCSSFAVPITPSPRSNMFARAGTSTGRGRAMPRPSFNRSNSTFSLPARTGYDSQEEDELVLRRCDDQAQLMAKVHEKEQELQDVHHALVEVEGERDQLLSRIEELQRDLSTAESGLSQLQQNLSNIEAALREKEESIGDQNVRLEAVMASLEAAKHQFENASQQNEELQKINRNLTAQIKENENSIASIKLEIQKVTKQKVELEERVQELKVAREAEMGEEMKAQEARIDRLESELSSKNEELEAIYATIEYWKHQAETKEEFNNQLQASIQKNAELIKQLETKVEAHQEAMKTSEASYQSKIDQTRQDLRDALTRAAEAELQLALKTRELQEIGLTVDSLTYEQDMLETELEQLRRDVSRHEEEKKAGDELISEKDCQLQDLHAELEAEKTCIEELRNKIKEAEAELDMSARSFHNSNELLKEEKLKRENLQNQLTDMEQQIVVLSTAHEERVKDLESQLSVQTTKLEEVKYSLSMEQANCSQLNSQLLQKGQELDVCQQNLHSAAHRITQLEACLQEATNEKNSIEGERDNLRKLLDETIAHKDEKLTQINEELKSERIQIENLNRQLEKEREELGKTVRETKEEAESEKNHRENIEIELSSLQQRLESVIAERSLEQQRHAECLTELQLKITAMEHEIQKYTASLKQEEEKSNVLGTQLAEASSMLNDTQSKLQDATSQISELTLQLSTKDQELELVQSNARELKENLDFERKKVDDLRVTIADQGIKIVTLEESVTQKDLEFSSLMRCLDNEKAQLEITTAKLDVTEKELASLQKALDTCSELLGEEQRSKESVRTKLETTEQNIRIQEAERAQERAEHQKRIAEFENKVTTQGIDIAQLKDDFDVCQCQANELKAHLDEKSLKLEETQKELQKTLGDLERERSEFESVRANLSKELAKSQEDLADAVRRGQDLKTRYDAAVDEREKHIKRLKQAELKLADYLDLQLRGCNQTAEIKKSETEILCLKNSLAKLEHHALTSKQKLATIEAEIAKHAASSDHWKQLHESASKEAQLAKAERAESEEKLGQQESRIRSLETQNANLQNLIGPFKDQLKEYKNHLDMEQDAAARQAMFANELAEKYASLVGHQNPKQRIHHMQKLKNDNLTLKNENTVLTKKLSQYQKRLEDLEGKLMNSHSGRRFDPNLAFKHSGDPEDIQNQQPL